MSTKEQSKGMTQRMHEIAVHTWKTQRKVDWEAATVIEASGSKLHTKKGC